MGNRLKEVLPAFVEKEYDSSRQRQFVAAVERRIAALEGVTDAYDSDSDYPYALANHVHGTVSASRGDASVTLTHGVDDPVQIFAESLTADRLVTLATEGAVNGAYFRVVRTGGGAFDLDVGGLIALPPEGGWVDVAFNGSAWVLTAW